MTRTLIADDKTWRPKFIDKYTSCGQLSTETTNIDDYLDNKSYCQIYRRLLYLNEDEIFEIAIRFGYFPFIEKIYDNNVDKCVDIITRNNFFDKCINIICDNIRIMNEMDANFFN